jgi:hypothetical protein
MPPQTRPAHPLPPALTPARSYEAVADPIRRPSAPKRIRLTRTPGQARAFAIVPKGATIPPLPPEGDGVEQTTRESTELLLPRAVVSGQARSLPGRSSDAETSFRPPTLSRRSPEGHPLRGTHEGVALNHPATPKGLRMKSRLTRSSTACVGRRRSTPKRRSVPASALTEANTQPEPAPVHRSRHKTDSHTTHSVAIIRRRPPARPDGSFKEPRRTCSCDRKRPLRAGRAATSEDKRLASRALPDRSQDRPATSASDPPHGSITDGARQQTGCATRGLQATSPEGSAAKETARSEGPTTPPMGFGAFQRNQPR